MTPAISTQLDPAFAREQRRFRRLEVSLPVWLTTREAFDSRLDVWELGYTRDLSLGGAKIVVPPGEEEQWREAAREKIPFVVRFENENATQSAIFALIRHVEREGKTGRLTLGVQFDEAEAKDARLGALNLGLSTKRARRRWQWAFVAATLTAFLAFFTVRGLQAEVAQRDGQIRALQAERKKVAARLATLSAPGLAPSKSRGVDAGFQREEVEARLSELNANIARLNDPKNMDEAIARRQQEAQSLGISLQAPSNQARVQLAMAVPYGYNWPLVLGDVERALGRKIPQIVIFADWSMKFPDLDAREARARGKTLQITWEPWHFSNPKAVKLADVASGKYDRHIDEWAASARSFGGEIWMRFAHEMNGNWYPWSLSNTGQNPKTYLAAYRRVHDRFRRAGASNVRWIWCINAESVPNVSWNNPYSTYPGDAYVDAVGIDGYNFGDTTHFSRWQSFEEIFAVPIAEVSRRYPQKPIFIAETGCSSTGGDKVQWLRDMDKNLRGPFSKVQSVTWFEAAKEADWRLLSSPETANAARKIFGQTVYRRGEF